MGNVRRENRRTWRSNRSLPRAQSQRQLSLFSVVQRNGLQLNRHPATLRIQSSVLNEMEP